MNRIIVKPSVLPPTLISGKVGKMGLDITLDTGADISTVHSKFVQPFEYLGRHISVSTVGGTKLSMPLAQVWIHIEDYSIHLTVAVDTKAREDVLLGRDVGPVLYDFIDLTKKRKAVNKVENVQTVPVVCEEGGAMLNEEEKDEWPEVKEIQSVEKEEEGNSDISKKKRCRKNKFIRSEKKLRK